MLTMRLKCTLKYLLLIVLTADLVTWQLNFVNAKDIVARTNTSVSANSQNQETAKPLGIVIPLSGLKTQPARENGKDARLISYYKSGFRFEPDKITKNDPEVNRAAKKGDQKITASDRTAWKLGRGANVQKSQPWAVHYATSEEIESKEGKKEASSEEVSDSSTQKTSNSKDDAHVIWAPNQEAAPNPWDVALSNGQEVWINGQLVSQPGPPNDLQAWNVPAPSPVADDQDGTVWDDAPGDDAVVEEWPNDADSDDSEAEWKEVGDDDEVILNNNGGGWDQGNSGKPVNAVRKQNGWDDVRPQWPPKPDGNNIQWKMYNENTQTMHDIDESSGWKVIGDGSDGWKVIDENGNVEWTIQNTDGEWRVSNDDEWKDDESTEEPYATTVTTSTTEETETAEVTEATTEETTEASTAMTESMATDETTENTASTESTTTTTTEMMTTTEDTSDESDKSEEADKSDEDKSYQDKSYENKKVGKYIVWKFKDNGQGEAKLYGGGGAPDAWTIGDDIWWPSPVATGWDAGNGGWYISSDEGYSKNNKGENGENPWEGNGGVKTNGRRKNGENRKGGKNGGYGNGSKSKNNSKNGNGGKGNGNGRKNGNGNRGKYGNRNGMKNGNGNGGKKKGNGNGRKNGNGNGGKNGNGNGGKNGSGNGGKNGNGNGGKSDNGSGGKNGNGKKRGNGNGGKYGSWSNGGNKSNGQGQNGRPKGGNWQGKNSNRGRSGNGGNKPYSKRNGDKNEGRNNGWKPSNQGWSAKDPSYQNGRKTKSNNHSQGTPYVIIIKTSNTKTKSAGARNPWVPSRKSNKGYPRAKSNRRQSSNGWQWDPNTGTIGGLQWMESWISAQTGLTADKNTVYTNWRPTKIKPPTNKRNGTNVWYPAPINIGTSVDKSTTSKKKPANSKGKQIIIIDYASKNKPKGEIGMKQDIENVLKVLKSAKPTGIKGQWPRPTSLHKL